MKCRIIRHSSGSSTVCQSSCLQVSKIDNNGTTINMYIKERCTFTRCMIFYALSLVLRRNIGL